MHIMTTNVEESEAGYVLNGKTYKYRVRTVGLTAYFNTRKEAEEYRDPYGEKNEASGLCP